MKPGYESSAVTTAEISVPIAGVPVIYPGGSTVDAGTLVTLRSATAGATIYYTLNGSLPDTSSSRYSGFISLPAGNVTLRAVAMKAGYSNSGYASATYTVRDNRPQNAVTVSLGSVDAEAGTVAAVPVYLFADQAVSGFELQIRFPVEAFESGVTVSPAQGGPKVFSLVDGEAGTVTLSCSNASFSGGELCTLNFTSLVTAAHSEQPIDRKSVV